MFAEVSQHHAAVQVLLHEGCLLDERARERERERHHFPGKSQSLLGSPCVGGAYDQHIVLHGLLELPASGSGRLDLEIG